MTAVSERCAVLRHVGVGGCVALIQVPPYVPGHSVTASLAWRGPAPAPDDMGATRELNSRLRVLSQQLGVRIDLPVHQHPQEHAQPAPIHTITEGTADAGPRQCPQTATLAS